MLTVDIGDYECYDQDTWEATPFDRWSDHPTRTWAEECNFKDSIVLLNNFEVDHSCDYRSTTSFEVWDENCDLEFLEGSIVTIRDDDSEIIFQGVISSGGGIETEVLLGPVYHQIHKVRAIDWTYLSDKRVISMAHDNMLAGNIVRDIITAVLAEEGVTVGEIQDGLVVTEFRAGYCTVTEALKALARYCGFVCYIDQLKQLYFVDRTTYVGDYDISEFTPQDTWKKTKGNANYRNREYLIGGKGTTNLITEEQKGDGSTKTFKVSRPLALVPLVKVNNVTKTIGILNVDPVGSHDFYWNEANDTITQDDNGTALSSTDVWHIEFYGLYDIINSASDYAEITRRAALDGTSGIVEEVMTGDLITTQVAAVNECMGRLKVFALDAEKIEFDTVEPIGKYLACGTILPCAVDPTKKYLITNLKIKSEQGLTVYSVTACDGPADTAWEDYWTELDLSATASTISLGSINGTSAVIFKSFSKTWYESDRPNPFNCAEVGNSTLPGNTLIPGFDPQDRWTYIVVYSSSAEIFRKEVTSVEHGTETDIISCIILEAECVGTISHIGLWGGEQCSDVAGSGIELDKQIYSRNKTIAETIQISFTEIMGWSNIPIGTADGNGIPITSTDLGSGHTGLDITLYG